MVSLITKRSFKKGLKEILHYCFKIIIKLLLQGIHRNISKYSMNWPSYLTLLFHLRFVIRTVKIVTTRLEQKNIVNHGFLEYITGKTINRERWCIDFTERLSKSARFIHRLFLYLYDYGSTSQNWIKHEGMHLFIRIQAWTSTNHWWSKSFFSRF